MLEMTTSEDDSEDDCADARVDARDDTCADDRVDDRTAESAPQANPHPTHEECDSKSAPQIHPAHLTITHHIVLQRLPSMIARYYVH